MCALDGLCAASTPQGRWEHTGRAGLLGGWCFERSGNKSFERQIEWCSQWCSASHRVADHTVHAQPGRADRGAGDAERRRAAGESSVEWSWSWRAGAGAWTAGVERSSRAFSESAISSLKCQNAYVCSPRARGAAGPDQLHGSTCSLCILLQECILHRYITPHATRETVSPTLRSTAMTSTCRVPL
jgi:hypothetical protein